MARPVLLLSLALAAAAAIVAALALQRRPPAPGVPSPIAASKPPTPLRAAEPLETAEEVPLRRASALLAHALRGTVASAEPAELPRDGYFRKRAPDGCVLEEGAYLHGEKEGPWIYRAATGAIELEGSYHHGRATGFWQGWHANGQKACEGSCEDGRLVGRVSFWSEDGSLDAARSGEYVDGERVRE